MIDYETFCKIHDCHDRQGLTITQTARALGLHPKGLALTGPSTAASSTAPGLKAANRPPDGIKSPRYSSRWYSVKFTALVTI